MFFKRGLGYLGVYFSSGKREGVSQGSGFTWLRFFLSSHHPVNHQHNKPSSHGVFTRLYNSIFYVTNVSNISTYITELLLLKVQFESVFSTFFLAGIGSYHTHRIPCSRVYKRRNQCFTSFVPCCTLPYFFVLRQWHWRRWFEGPCSSFGRQHHSPRSSSGYAGGTSRAHEISRPPPSLSRILLSIHKSRLLIFVGIFLS